MLCDCLSAGRYKYFMVMGERGGKYANEVPKFAKLIYELSLASLKPFQAPSSNVSSSHRRILSSRSFFLSFEVLYRIDSLVVSFRSFRNCNDATSSCIVMIIDLSRSCSSQNPFR
jgi:hypothetical protein